MVLAAGVTIVAATGYLAYGYATGWKGSAYSIFSPRETYRRQKKVQSPFHGQVEWPKQHSTKAVEDDEQAEESQTSPR